jgi:DNA-binding transcriptional ArsR family regulator/precorrin-6B methylase 2
MDELIRALKAAGEPTRLRILLALDRSELTVTEICRILGQSQPRVSRHLKLLCDAGLLVRQAEGTSAFYRHASTDFARQFLASVGPLADLTDSTAARDQERLTQVRAQRAELAARSFVKLRSEQDVLRGRHVDDDVVEQAMLDAVGDRPIDRLLDIGTGTGRVLELFAPRIGSGLGIELSREMLNLARTQLEARRLDHCAVRYGNAYNLDVETGSVGLAVLHHVLHFLDEPARAIYQAAHSIRAKGRLLVVDFAPHDVEVLRSDHGHRRLGFTDEEVAGWCEAADLAALRITHLEPADELASALTVTIWIATQRPDAPTLCNLEVA